MHMMLNDDAFVRLVAEDVKNKVSEEQRCYLRMSENIPRWKRSLEALLSNLEDQLADLAQREAREIERFGALGDDGFVLMAEYQTDIEARRRKIGRFRFHVESRLDEAERMLAMSGDKADERGRTAEFLRSAIAKHREVILSNGFDYSEIDEALWAALIGQWDFDDIDLVN